MRRLKYVVSNGRWCNCFCNPKFSLGGKTEKIKLLWFHKFIVDSINCMLILFGRCYASCQ